MFDAKSGELPEKIDVKTVVGDMAVFNDNRALTTAEGLKFVALKKSARAPTSARPRRVPGRPESGNGRPARQARANVNG